MKQKNLIKTLLRFPTFFILTALIMIGLRLTNVFDAFHLLGH